MLPFHGRFKVARLGAGRSQDFEFVRLPPASQLAGAGPTRPRACRRGTGRRAGGPEPRRPGMCLDQLRVRAGELVIDGEVRPIVARESSQSAASFSDCGTGRSGATGFNGSSAARWFLSFDAVWATSLASRSSTSFFFTSMTAMPLAAAALEPLRTLRADPSLCSEPWMRALVSY